MLRYLLNLMSCPYPSVFPRIITTLLFQAYTYNWVMLLIVSYDSVMLVRMNWFTDEGVTTIRDGVAISIVHVGCNEIYIVRWEQYEW